MSAPRRKSIWARIRNPESRHRSFGRYLKASSPWLILIIAGIGFFLKAIGTLHQWEMFGLDPLLSSDIYKAQNIVVVRITDEDYNTFFGGRSPLDPQILKELLLATARGKPAVIVVDLDLSDSPQACVQATGNALIDNALIKACPGSGQPVPGKPPCCAALNPSVDVAAEVETEVRKMPDPKPVIIWAQVTDRMPRLDKEPRLKAQPPTREHLHLGVPLFPRDRDGAVRSYVHRVRVNDGGECKMWPTLPWAAYEAGEAHPFTCGEGRDEEEVFFNFSGDRYTFYHTDVASLLDWAPLTPQSPGIGVLHGKTVIIGGDYAAARDEYFTPIGPLAGVDLIAYALETENRHTGIRPVDETIAVCADVLFALLIVWLGYRFILPAAVLMACAATLVLPVLGSYLLFHSWNFWLSFVPIMLGAFAHVLIHGTEHAMKTEEELHELLEENRDLHRKNNQLLKQLNEFRSAPGPTAT